MSRRRANSAADQVTASVVESLNSVRRLAEQQATAAQAEAFEKALAEFQTVREFIGKPEEILGSQLTKHGEIAEVVEVGIRRSRDCLLQRSPTAFDEPNRFSSVDYWIDGKAVQSKFVNGASKTLDHVLDHKTTYPTFGSDGASFYHIPKDQFDLIQRVRAGDIDGLSKKTVTAIERQVAEIERKCGKGFEEVVQPATSTYAEVQQGNIHSTLDRHEDELSSENDRMKDDIVKEHEPSFHDGLKTTAIATGVAAGLGFVTSCGKKYFQEKKNVFRGDFTRQDWKEVGLETAVAGGVGAVTAASVYVLTNYADVAAPLAAAYVSAAKGVGSLALRYQRGEISGEAFVDDALLVCTDVAVVALFSAAGQAAIPIPVLGALIGSFAGKACVELLESSATKEIELLKQRLDEARKALDRAHEKRLSELESTFIPIQRLTAFAFDLKRNADLLGSSIDVARLHGVEERRILKSADDVVRYLSNP